MIKDLRCPTKIVTDMKKKKKTKTEGFEPPDQFPDLQLSRLAQSSALPNLHHKRQRQDSNLRAGLHRPSGFQPDALVHYATLPKYPW